MHERASNTVANLMAQIDRTNKPKRVVRRTINAATAAEAVGPIFRGMEVYGLSKGQFSLVELIEHVLAATGPAHLTVSTWTAAGADLAHAQSFLSNGGILSTRWLVDFSFPSRQPGYCAQLRERFGDAAIRCTANHAKFVLVRNETWNMVIRTSMNLNWNRRLESYELSEDADLADWLQTIVDATFAGDAATVADAATAPCAAGSTVSTIGGAVAKRPERQLEFASLGAGIAYE